MGFVKTAEELDRYYGLGVRQFIVQTHFEAPLEPEYEPFFETANRAAHPVDVPHVAGCGDHASTGAQFGLERDTALLEMLGVTADQRQARPAAGEGPAEARGRGRLKVVPSSVRCSPS